jgi:hypothetical protein
MERQVFTPEEGEELQRLQAEHASLTAQAQAAIARYGMDSPEFEALDRAAGERARRIKEIRGIPADADWTSY